KSNRTGRGTSAWFSRRPGRQTGRTSGPELPLIRKAENVIAPGTILIERDTLLPESFRLENESDPSAWRPVTTSLNSHALENELAATGWTFFYMAGAASA